MGLEMRAWPEPENQTHCVPYAGSACMKASSTVLCWAVFAASLIACKSSSRVLEEGEGEEHPTATSIVTVNYSSWTTEGEIIESSIVRGEPATFRLDQVIPGLMLVFDVELLDIIK
jgi:hypothetical protein